MRNGDMFKIITNIPDIPDHRLWSVLASPAQNLGDVSNDLKQAKIRARTSAVTKLTADHRYRPPDDLGDPLDMERWQITDNTVIEKISNILGFTKPSGRVQVLAPGCMVPLHHDDLAFGYIDGAESSYQHQPFTTEEITEFNDNANCAQRVLVMLEDWHPGQYLVFHDAVCDHWSRGDVIHWDWINVEHATINAGYWRRPLLRLTGLVDSGWLAKYYPLSVSTD